MSFRTRMMAGPLMLERFSLKPSLVVLQDLVRPHTGGHRADIRELQHVLEGATQDVYTFIVKSIDERLTKA